MMTLEAYLAQNYRDKGLLNLIKHYCNYCNTKEKTASYQDIINYISWLRKKNCHPKTIRNHLFAIKIYYRYLQDTGQRSDHPCRKLYLKDQINSTIAVEKLYSKAQLESLLKQHYTQDKKALLRNRIIISLLIYQGLLVSEITNLKVGEVNLKVGEIFIEKSAKTSARTLPLQSNQILLFYKYLKLKKASDYFITSQKRSSLSPHLISGLINENRAKSDWMQPLKIRQSVIANLLKQNKDLRVVQVFMGHHQSSTTKKYEQSDFEQLQQQIDKYHPVQ